MSQLSLLTAKRLIEVYSSEGRLADALIVLDLEEANPAPGVFTDTFENIRAQLYANQNDLATAGVRVLKAITFCAEKGDSESLCRITEHLSSASDSYMAIPRDEAVATAKKLGEFRAGDELPGAKMPWVRRTAYALEILSAVNAMDEAAELVNTLIKTASGLCSTELLIEAIALSEAFDLQDKVLDALAHPVTIRGYSPIFSHALCHELSLRALDRSAWGEAIAFADVLLTVDTALNNEDQHQGCQARAKAIKVVATFAMGNHTDALTMATELIKTRGGTYELAEVLLDFYADEIPEPLARIKTPNGTTMGRLATENTLSFFGGLMEILTLSPGNPSNKPISTDKKDNEDADNADGSNETESSVDNEDAAPQTATSPEEPGTESKSDSSNSNSDNNPLL